MNNELDLSIVIPALNEGPNLALLLPELRKVLDELGINYDVSIITRNADADTIEVAARWRARVIEQSERGYGGALLIGFAKAEGEYILTLDADLSHRPIVVRDLWLRRQAAELSIASRYVHGGSATMPASRYLLSRILNFLFSRGLRLPVQDMSSGFRLYKASVLKDRHFQARDFDILQEILVRIYAEGCKIQEVPFRYEPREHGSSHARVFQFGKAYIRTFIPLWKLRNSITASRRRQPGPK